VRRSPRIATRWLTRFAADETLAPPPSAAFESTADATEAADVASEPSTLPAATLDTARQTQARRYARQQQRLSLVNLGLGALLVGVLLFSGLSFWLRDALAVVPAWQPFAGWLPLRVGAYFLALFFAAFIIGLPLSYYSGHILPRRNGLSTQSLGGWLVDEAKGLALGLVFEILAVEGIYALLAASPRWWWLWAGAAVLCVTALLANLAPVLLLPLFYKLTPLPDGEVRRRALARAAQAHTRVRGIYSMNMSARTTAANAMVMGLGVTRRIVIGDTLLNHYMPDEIEVVVAHELGHQVHRDIPKLILAQTVITLGGLYVVNVIVGAILRAFPQYHGLADPATMPLIAATLAAFGLVTLPLTNGFSRWVEHQADVYALESTGMTAAFVSAMTRLANQNLAEVEPSPLIEFLLYNHPSIGRRLAFGQAWAQRIGASDLADGAAQATQ
jgi:STE24 endopeptidase